MDGDGETLIICQSTLFVYILIKFGYNNQNVVESRKEMNI